MKRLSSLTLALALLLASTAHAQEAFQFGVIGHSFVGTADDSQLRKAIRESDADNLAFVVVNGIKSASEPCSDALYGERRAVLDEAENGIVVSLAASDWVGCKTRNEKSAAIERLNRVRELFFQDEFSFGASKIPVLRQSITPKFRAYTENARWEVGSILFATINLPSGNNHFLPDGGRNSEFEDRLIANRDWLQRLFTFATSKKLKGIVLFCDANPLTLPHQRPFLFRGQRDGFSEIRQRLTTLTADFPGKVLLVHSESTPRTDTVKAINWKRNLGSVGVGPGWIKLAVRNNSSTLFTLAATTPREK